MSGFPATIRYASGYGGTIVGLVMGGVSVAVGPLVILLSRGLFHDQRAFIGSAVAGVVSVALGAAIIGFSCARVGDTAVGTETLTLGTWCNLRKTPLRYADMAQVALQDFGTDATDYRIAVVMKDGRAFSLEESRLNDRKQLSGPSTLDLLLDYLVARIRGLRGQEDSR